MKSSVYFIATCIAVERESKDGEIDLGRESRVSPTRLFRFISTRQMAKKDEQKSTLVKARPGTLSLFCIYFWVENGLGPNFRTPIIMVLD